MRILVLGGYGLIGAEVTKRLMRDGHVVTGLARSAQRGMALIPAAQWIGADISTLRQPDSWHEHLKEIDVVVNASGALQNGWRDNVAAVQRDSILALIKACEKAGVKRFVQISAPGAKTNSSTLFYQTKAEADNGLKSSTLGWTIFRPGLVIAPHAYGGTSLIRKLAAFPVFQPIVMADTPIQTVSIEDVASAVSIAIKDRVTGVDVDLVEENPQSLLELTLNVRNWLGFNPPKAIWAFPSSIGSIVARLADMAGWLGWRSALRTTSMKVLAEGVKGEPDEWNDLTKTENKSLIETLSDLPSTMQERVYARAMLVFPILVLTLAGFWIASGLIGIAQHDNAVAKLDGALAKGTANIFVRLGSYADIAIGAAILFRPLTRIACLASVLLSAGYLIGAAIFTPHLWVDPLGPMLKVFPIIALAVIVSFLLEER